jgi:hypothetical protein
MRTMSITVLDTDENDTVARLKDDGAHIFRIHSLDGYRAPPFPSRKIKIIFIVIDEATEILLKLKYPPGTFEEHDA